MLNGIGKNFVRFAGVLSACSIISGYTSLELAPVRFWFCVMMVIAWAHTEWEVFRSRRNGQEKD